MSTRRHKNKKGKSRHKKGAGNDSRFFSSQKKGEIVELRRELNSLKGDIVKDAVKKVIASMTVGKDVSSLFPDVLKRMHTEDVELKKLVYLYIITYARNNPKEVLLSVNSFQKDAAHRSPLIRALVIRTIGCIRLPSITDYFCKALAEALKDGDPYVRKTAAVCVAKLFDVAPESVEEHGFIKSLRLMISDHNAMVVANAVAALAEIAESTAKDVFKITPDMLNKLLAAMNECTEWGVVFILDCLAKFNPTAKQAESVIERVVPRLVSNNSAVTLSAVKVIIKYLDLVSNQSMRKFVLRDKVPKPLITMLSGDKPEIQYVALRNINLVLQKEPHLLDKHIRHFFCKYNDPLYVKLEKLEIMARVASDENFEKLLMELRAYSSEVDETFVRKAIATIGRVAVKLDKAARKSMRVLLDIIKANPGGQGEGKEREVGFVAQNAVAVMADILRKYPNRFEKVVDIVCKNGIDGFDEEKPLAAMIWIIGEYSTIVEDAPEYIEEAIENFDDMDEKCQLSLLTATVKLFLKRPDDAKEMVQGLLKKASSNVDNPDLRDRAYVYWRMLATDAKVAQQVILSEKPKLADDTGKLAPEVLKTLISNMASLASVYHKTPELFIQGGKESLEIKGHARREVDSDDSDDSDEDEDSSSAESEEEVKETKQKIKSQKKSDPMNLLFMDDGPSNTAPSLPVVLAAKQGNGLQINAGFSRNNGEYLLHLSFQNSSQTLCDQFAIKVNVNFLGLSPTTPKVAINPIQPGQSGSCTHKFVRNPNAADTRARPGQIQVALKTRVGVLYFNVPFGYQNLFSEDGRLPQSQYLQMWKSLPGEEAEVKGTISKTQPEAIKSSLSAANVFFVASRKAPQGKEGMLLYFSLKVDGTPVLVELTIAGNTLSGAAKSQNINTARASLNAIAVLLR